MSLKDKLEEYLNKKIKDEKTMVREYYRFIISPYSKETIETLELNNISFKILETSLVSIEKIETKNTT